MKSAEFLKLSSVGMPLLGLLLTLGGCSSEKKPATGPAAPSAIAVQVLPLAAQPLQQPIRASGKLTSASELRLAFKVGGVVAQLSAWEGDLVRRGQVLASLNQAEANAQVVQAQAAYDRTLRDQQRTQNLYRDSVGTLEQVQNAGTSTLGSRAALRVAQFNQQYATITAPVSGRILRRQAEPGELVAANAPVFLLSSSDADWVIKAGLADRDVVRVRRGDAARIQLDAYPEVVFEGRVSQVAQAADPATGTYEVEIRLQPAGHRLVSGLVAEVEVMPGSTGTRAPAVPLEALTEANGDQGFVYALQPDQQRVRKEPVQVVSLRNGQAFLRTALPLGTLVVGKGAAYLTPQSRVTVSPR